MKFRSKQKDLSFFELFAKSAKCLVSGAEILAQILGAAPAERPALRDRLHDVEHEADEINHAVSAKLNRTFVTPLDRDDLSLLASRLDTCMDYMYEAGDFIVLYKIEELPSGVAQQINVLQQCADLTAQAMPGLKKVEDLREYWVEINRLENEGDLVFRKLLVDIFDSGKDAITIIKLKDIVESLEKAADSFELLAEAAQTIAIKES